MKNCKYCGKDFEPARKTQVFCSKKCLKNEWYHRVEGAKEIEHICENCGIAFLHKFKKKRFCSQKCSATKFRRDHPEIMRERWKQQYHNDRERYLERQKDYRDKSGINKKRTDNGYSTFYAIQQRCNNHKNRSYKYYGANGIQLLLTFEEFQSIYFRTSKCELCDKPLSDENRKKGKDSRTIDRIDSAKHYTVTNIQIICRSCNTKRMLEAKRKS